jgi:hypothetical protein
MALVFRCKVSSTVRYGKLANEHNGSSSFSDNALNLNIGRCFKVAVYVHSNVSEDLRSCSFLAGVGSLRLEFWLPDAQVLSSAVPFFCALVAGRS